MCMLFFIPFSNPTSNRSPNPLSLPSLSPPDFLP